MKLVSYSILTLFLTTYARAIEPSFRSSEARTAHHQYQKSLEEAQAHYLRSLASALRVAMKKGDLEEAKKIEAEIKKQKLQEPSIPTNNNELQSFLAGTKWKFSDGKILTLHKDGKVRKSWGILQPVWKVSKMELQFEKHTFKFNPSFNEMKSQSTKRYQGTAKLIKD